MVDEILRRAVEFFAIQLSNIYKYLTNIREVASTDFIRSHVRLELRLIFKSKETPGNFREEDCIFTNNYRTVKILYFFNFFV